MNLSDHISRGMTTGCVLLASIGALAGCAANVDSKGVPIASEPRGIRAFDDPVNAGVRGATTGGIVVVVRVSEAGIELTDIALMLVPKQPRDVSREGPYIAVSAYGNGEEVSRATVSDPQFLIREKELPTPLTDRSVSVAVPAPRWVDTLEVKVSGTGATKRFDVSKVTRRFCAVARNEPMCSGSPTAPSP